MRKAYLNAACFVNDMLSDDYLLRQNCGTTRLSADIALILPNVCLKYPRIYAHHLEIRQQRFVGCNTISS
jgi:hypothetical protein